MNLGGVQGAGPASPPTVVAPASTAVEKPVQDQQQPAAKAEQQLDPVTNQPVPPRFPWLSRLAMELEKASNQPAPYGTPANLGNSVNKSA